MPGRLQLSEVTGWMVILNWALGMAVWESHWQESCESVKVLKRESVGVCEGQKKAGVLASRGGF